MWCRAHSIQHIRSMYDVRRNLRSLVFRVEKKGFLWCYWKFWLRTRNRPCVRVAGNEWWMKLNQSPNLVSFKYLKEVQIALHWFWQNLYNGLVAGSRLGWVWLNSKVKKTQNMFVGTVEIVFFPHTNLCRRNKWGGGYIFISMAFTSFFHKGFLLMVANIQTCSYFLRW